MVWAPAVVTAAPTMEPPAIKARRLMSNTWDLMEAPAVCVSCTRSCGVGLVVRLVEKAEKCFRHILPASYDSQDLHGRYAARPNMSAFGTKRLLEAGQSMSALPRYFRHQPVPLLPMRRRPRCRDSGRCFRSWYARACAPDQVESGRFSDRRRS